MALKTTLLIFLLVTSLPSHSFRNHNCGSEIEGLITDLVAHETILNIIGDYQNWYGDYTRAEQTQLNKNIFYAMWYAFRGRCRLTEKYINNAYEIVDLYF